MGITRTIPGTTKEKEHVGEERTNRKVRKDLGPCPRGREAGEESERNEGE